MDTAAISNPTDVMGPRPLSVSELARLLRETVRSNPLLEGVLVRGETSNVQRAAGGVVFFTLKDARAQIACVLFREPATSLSFELEDGAEVLATGDVDLYPRKGEVQLLVRTVEPVGIGMFWATFQRTRKALAAEGLFAEERKRPLPTYPGRIGVVTSPSGAVLHDIVTILRRRFPLAGIVVSPALVQGPGAAASLREALANVATCVDVVILARGGGSLEDLWCFNDETLARAIAACPVPVISAVGHETDITIADFVADVRAPTPSAAAELASPDLQELRSQVRALGEVCLAGIGDLLKDRRMAVAAAGDRLSPEGLRRDLVVAADRVRRSRVGLEETAIRFLASRSNRLDALADQLDAVSPLGTLRRGYAIVERPSGGVVTLASQIVRTEPLFVRLQDGRVHVHVDAKQEEA